MVLGWYRIPDAARSKTGNVVKIITYAGFIILDGAEMTFEEVVGKVFSEAGFDVINGRKLLGMYELIGKICFPAYCPYQCPFAFARPIYFSLTTTFF